MDSADSIKARRAHCYLYERSDPQDPCSICVLLAIVDLLPLVGATRNSTGLAGGRQAR